MTSFLIIAETEEAAHQGPLASEAPAGVALGAEGIQVGQDHGGEGVAAPLELGSAGLPVQELQASEVQSERSSEGPGLEVVGPPGGPIVGEDREAEHRGAAAIEDPVVIDEHAFGEGRLGAGLDLDVDEDPGLVTGAEEDLDQKVHDPGAQLRLRSEALELLVEEGDVALPSDLFRHLGQEELDAGLEVAPQHRLPGAVVGVALGHGVGPDHLCWRGVVDHSSPRLVAFLLTLEVTRLSVGNPRPVGTWTAVRGLQAGDSIASGAPCRSPSENTWNRCSEEPAILG